MDYNNLGTSIRNLHCKLNKKKDSEKIPKIVMSNPFSRVIIGNYASPNVSQEVKYRLGVSFRRLQHSGLISKEETFVPTELIYCISIMDMNRDRPRDEIMIPLEIFIPIVACFLVSLLMTLMILMIERRIARFNEYVSHLSLEQQNRWWIKCLILIFKKLIKPNRFNDLI